MSIEFTNMVWHLSSLKGSERFVLMCIAHHADIEGKCWPSIKTIAREVGLSLSTVKKALSNLQKEQWIFKTNRFVELKGTNQKQSNIYRINRPKLHSDRRSVKLAVSEPDIDLAIGRELTEGKVELGHKPSIEQSKERSLPFSKHQIKGGELDNAFEQFWNAGLVKLNRKKAKQHFEQLVKRKGFDAPQLQNFTLRLVEDIQCRINQQQFGINKLHPATYLNQERWEDEHENIQQHGGTQFGFSRKLTSRETFILGQLEEYGPELVLQAGIASESDVRLLWPALAAPLHTPRVMAGGVATIQHGGS
ncbi:helix-turn-helix domain-containing protein [Vibrio cholerae]|uniref:helix-turn-helix domain-containing protein n=1 Tax=Vibrio cholerae TaxID=666 RepID=UPI0004E2AF10|nr:helix-turn-helix domain-containing protein [Vibrio cholerae]EGR2519325.1 helix-turn-helix domain-containing protein [Vibrio cholerae]KFE09508.1 winged helix-turn-helix DNA-binding family protein [Vibrio cholerae]TXZ80720.1 helix-turn-helix domain-containing protein [Vibrio cholerae]GHZ68780.1 transcriptional regulator [Vibrio cholerae]GHZ93642.1 transcriptional regulator [Vibrio cholerae]